MPSTVDAWVSGVKSDEATTRTRIPPSCRQRSQLSGPTRPGVASPAGGPRLPSVPVGGWSLTGSPVGLRRCGALSTSRASRQGRVFGGDSTAFGNHPLRRRRTAFWPMLLIPQIPYVGCMQTSKEELVVFCSECEHSEFVHADRERRLCLFSDCDCSGFGISTGLEASPRSAVSGLRTPGDVSATSRA